LASDEQKERLKEIRQLLNNNAEQNNRNYQIDNQMDEPMEVVPFFPNENDIDIWNSNIDVLDSYNQSLFDGSSEIGDVVSLSVVPSDDGGYNGNYNNTNVPPQIDEEVNSFDNPDGKTSNKVNSNVLIKKPYKKAIKKTEEIIKKTDDKIKKPEKLKKEDDKNNKITNFIKDTEKLISNNKELLKENTFKPSIALIKLKKELEDLNKEVELRLDVFKHIHKYIIKDTDKTKKDNKLPRVS
jgi:hypothetical protein